MEEATRRHTPHICPVHTVVPGRARIKVEGLRGDFRLAGRMEQILIRLKGVHRVSASSDTGNLLILYDDQIITDNLLDRIDTIVSVEA